MFDRVLNTSLNILQVIRKTVRFTKQENSFLQSKKYLGTFTDRQTNTKKRQKQLSFKISSRLPTFVLVFIDTVGYILNNKNRMKKMNTKSYLKFGKPLSFEAMKY